MTKHSTGLLWYLAGQPLQTALPRAIDCYLQRLGTLPNVVYVRPGCTTETQLCGLAVREAAHITPAHIWLTVDPELPVQSAPLPTPETPTYQQISLFGGYNEPA